MGQWELSKAFWRYVSGRQDPSNKRKLTSIVVMIILLLIAGYIGTKIDDWNAKKDANIQLEPYVKNNSYVPIQITNGAKPLKNVQLKIKTCHMEKFEYSPKYNLIEHEPITYPLEDKNTLFALNNIHSKCNPEEKLSPTHCWIKTYVVNGKTYAPPQECVNYYCDYCEYEAVLEAEEFSKSFNGSFYSPIETKRYELKITPSDGKIKDISNASEFSDIKISFFTSYDQCVVIKGKNNPICEGLPNEVNLQGGGLMLEISPTNESLGILKVNITSVN